MEHRMLTYHETIKSQLGNLDTVDFLKPSYEEILVSDLQIWVSQARGPSLSPIHGSSSILGSNQSWETQYEDVLFQR